MGGLVDVLAPARDGRYRPWRRRMTIPVALLAIACFAPFVRNWPLGWAMTWMGGSYLLYGLAFSAINIPYGSMASVISPNPLHRSTLSVFRALFAMIGGALVISLAYFVYATDPASGQQVLSPVRMPIAAIACGTLAVVLHLACYYTSVERVSTPHVPRSEQPSFTAVLAAMARNRSLLAIIFASLLLVIAVGILQGLQSYLWLDYFRDGRLQLWGGLALLLPALMLAPFATRLGARYGKREVAAVGMLVGAASCFLGWGLRLHNPWWFLLISLFGGVGVGMFNLLVWAMITDVIDYQELHTGHRDNGTVYATYSWARKLGTALAGGLTGWLLALIGYRSSHGVHVEQNAATIRGIYAGMTLLPGLFFLAMGLALILWYPLGRQQVLDNAAELSVRHDQQTA
jgi:GPH family glycoside/pentoside/hexuronide:cation symporter